jgi:plastocyanin
MKKLNFAFVFFVALLMISGCRNKPQQVDVSITPPAISVNVTRESCPSIELEAGMWVTWTNVDTVSLPIKIEYLDENGKVTDTGMSEIDSGATFSTNFPEAGISHVYCTDNADTHATITVK